MGVEAYAIGKPSKESIRMDSTTGNVFEFLSESKIFNIAAQHF